VAGATDPRLGRLAIPRRGLKKAQFPRGIAHVIRYRPAHPLNFGLRRGSRSPRDVKYVVRRGGWSHTCSRR